MEALLPLSIRALTLRSQWRASDGFMRRNMVRAGWLSAPEGEGLTRLCENLDAAPREGWWENANAIPLKMRPAAAERLLAGLDPGGCVPKLASLLSGNVEEERALSRGLKEALARRTGPPRDPARDENGTAARVIKRFEEAGYSFEKPLKLPVVEAIRAAEPELTAWAVRSILQRERTRRKIRFFAETEPGKRQAILPTRPTKGESVNVNPGEIGPGDEPDEARAAYREGMAELFARKESAAQRRTVAWELARRLVEASDALDAPRERVDALMAAARVVELGAQAT